MASNSASSSTFRPRTSSIPRSPNHVDFLGQLVRNAKYVVGGAAGCWWLGVGRGVERVLGLGLGAGAGSGLRRGHGPGTRVRGRWAEWVRGAERAGLVAMQGGVGRWNRRTMQASLFLHGITVMIFLYLVLVLPWFQGYTPNYSAWQNSRRLRVLVPMLTITISLGYISMIVALAKGTDFSVLASILGASAFYSLTFGLLGLVPTPTVKGPARPKAA